MKRNPAGASLFVCELGSNGLKLFPKFVFTGNVVGAFQHVPDCRFMFLMKLTHADGSA